MSDALLTIDNLSITFRTQDREVHAVRNASLEVFRGQTVAIVGESGSGKSTLTSAINRLLPSNGDITSGDIVFDGRSVLSLSERAMTQVRGREIGLVPQDPMSNLNPLMSVGKQIAEVFTTHKLASPRGAKAQAIELLRTVGIADPERRYRQYPHEFSGGMRQRVLLAMGLACKPQLLIADEPTSALDVTVQKIILDEIATLTREMGTTVLMVTHDLALAAERADFVVVMNKGEIVESGAAAEILANPEHEYTKRLVSAAPSLSTASMVAPLTDTDFNHGPGATRDNIIDVVALTKNYKVRSGALGQATNFTAVDDISFSIPRGKTVGIVGESGSGKSTTAKMVLQLETSSYGDILFEGKNVTKASGSELFQFRRRVQPVFQNPYASLDPRYTIGDAIREPLDVHKVGTPAERDARVLQLLDQVALPADFATRLPHELSGGQRQRVSIARALALEPEIVILDEAVSALDVLVQAQILELLVDLQERLGLSYLFISHDLAVVRMISHYVNVMQKGKIVESGTPDEIFDNPQHDYTKTLLAAIPAGER